MESFNHFRPDQHQLTDLNNRKPEFTGLFIIKINF